MLHSPMFWIAFISAHSLDLTVIGENDSRIRLLEDYKGTSLLPQWCQTLGRNEQRNKPSRSWLVNGHSFLNDSYVTPAYVPIIDFINFKATLFRPDQAHSGWYGRRRKQCYSNRCHNILMQWKPGWNTIAASQQTETSWHNWMARETDSAFRCYLRLRVLPSKTALFGVIVSEWYVQNQFPPYSGAQWTLLISIPSNAIICSEA